MTRSRTRPSRSRTRERPTRTGPTGMTTHMWSIIGRGDHDAAAGAGPGPKPRTSSEDGRGPLFWAYEYEKYGRSFCR